MVKLLKNLCNKTRPFNDPYAIWQTPDGRWTWKVLRKYQSPENEKKNPCARWFCAVRSPFIFGYEYGDVYIKDITEHAVRIK